MYAYLQCCLLKFEAQPKHLGIGSMCEQPNTTYDIHLLGFFFFFFFFFNMFAQEGGERFELVISALLGVVSAD
jgi:hypothetical protein